MKTTLIFLFLLTTPLAEYMNGDYTIYRRQVDGQEQFYSNSQLFVNFLGTYNTESPLIFDINGSGVVDTNDMLMILTGYGYSYPMDHLDSVTINIQYSHGWLSTYPEAAICFTHPTIADENQSSFQPGDTLKSFWIEYVFTDSLVKEWVYKVN